MVEPELAGATASTKPTPSLRIGAIHLLNEGIGLEQRGMSDAALEQVKAAVAIDPALAQGHWVIGAMHRRAGRLADAERALRDAVRTMGDDRNADYPFMLATTLIALAEAELDPARRDAMEGDALANLGLTLALDSGHYKAHYRIGTIFEARGEDAEAAAAYERSIAVHPAYSAAFVALGALKIRNWDRAGGMAVFERGLKLNDADALMWRGYGQALQRTGEPAKALTALARAKAIDPDLAELDLDRALALADLGRVSDAKAALKAFHDRAPADTTRAARRAAESLSTRLATTR